MLISSIGNLPELSGWYALIGFVLLFAVLIAVVYGAKALKSKLKKPAKSEAPAVEIASSEPATAPGSSGEMLLLDVSEREAALVIAIVADELGTPVNQLKFLSIKKKSAEDNKK